LRYYVDRSHGAGHMDVYGAYEDVCNLRAAILKAAWSKKESNMITSAQSVHAVLAKLGWVDDVKELCLQLRQAAGGVRGKAQSMTMQEVCELGSHGATVATSNSATATPATATNPTKPKPLASPTPTSLPPPPPKPLPPLSPTTIPCNSDNSCGSCTWQLNACSTARRSARCCMHTYPVLRHSAPTCVSHQLHLLLHPQHMPLRKCSILDKTSCLPCCSAATFYNIFQMHHHSAAYV
jgi:hypothetical protein